MPSKALSKFENKMIVDVDRLIDSHKHLNNQGPGKRGLGHITRSGIFMLCASWELYLEETLQEAARYLANLYDLPTELPTSVQKEIAKYVASDLHELKPLQLAGMGWREVYIERVDSVCERINTPKSHVIDPLFEQFIGIRNLSDSWTIGKSDLNDFVKMRGEIAHRGSDAQYIIIGTLCTYRDEILQTVIESDNAVADFIKEQTGRFPWKRRVA